MQEKENTMLVDEQLKSINGGFELTQFPDIPKDNTEGLSEEHLGQTHLQPVTFPEGMGSLPQQGQPDSDLSPWAKRAQWSDGWTPSGYFYNG